MISFLLASLIVIFLGVLLTCYSILEPPLRLTNQTVYSLSVTRTRTDGHKSPLQIIIMNLLISLKWFEHFLRKNDKFLTRIVGYNIFGVLLTCYSLLEPLLVHILCAAILFYNTIYWLKIISNVKTNIFVTA